MPDPGSARDWRSVHSLLLWLAVALGTWPLQGQIRPLGYAQRERSSIHMLELEAHRGVAVDYARADSIAATLPPPLPRALPPVKEIVGYLPYWKYSSYPSLNYNLLTQINYFSAELDAQGNITNDHNWPRTELISFAHARGVKVKLCATLSGGTALATLLGSTANRQRAINNLLAAVQDAGADGVDIDFEAMPAGQNDNMVTFMRDLTDDFHTNLPGSIVTLAMPAVDWGGRWDYSALADIVDGMFIMAYDYHWSSGPTAGPVSPLDGSYPSISWNVRLTVNDYLSKTGSNTDKIILGLPYYGQDWPVVSTEKYAQTTGPAALPAPRYPTAYDMAQTHDRQWDQASSTPWFNYQDNGFRQVWYDDSLSLSFKYELALDSDLAGVGMWALGYDGDRPELWGALDDYLRGVRPPEPTDVVADVVDGTVRLRWSHSCEEALTCYRVYRYTLPYPDAAYLIATIQKDSTAYVDSGAVYGVTFYYWVSAVDTLGNESELSASVSARPRDQSRPCILYQNYPNPFRGITLILFDLSEAGNVRLSVYDLRGALVRTLVSGYRGEDSYTYPFLPVDAAGRRLASGIYFVTLRVDEGEPDTRKMVLLR